MSIFFIAEAGVNHNGDLQTALRLIDVAAEAGADAVKFQSFKADKTVLEQTQTVAYQKKSGQTDQHELLRRLELSQSDHQALFRRCAEVGIEFISTAFDVQSLEMLVDVGIRRIKVPSGELTNIPFLRKIASYDLEVILSTGMGTMEEIAEAVEVIRATRASRGFALDLAEKLTILHCTSSYPAPHDQLNLSSLRTLAETFHLPVGYSDHSMGLATGCMAVALGAVAYEKHFTLDRSMPGPDHAASLEPQELVAFIRQIRDAEVAMGDGRKRPMPCEMEARRLVRRSLYAARDLPAGSVITEDDVLVVRPSNVLHPRSLDVLIGSTLTRAISRFEPFLEVDLAP